MSSTEGKHEAEEQHGSNEGPQQSTTMTTSSTSKKTKPNTTSATAKRRLAPDAVTLCLGKNVRDELLWRWHFAEGDIVPTPPTFARMLSKMKSQKAISRCKELRCGLVYVSGAGQHHAGTFELEAPPVEAIRKLREVDDALNRIGSEAAGVLWLALGAQLRLGLNVWGPLCNLIPLVAEPRYRLWSVTSDQDAAARPSLLGWLEDLAERHRVGALSDAEREQIANWQRAAEQQLRDAGSAYLAARQ